MAIFNFIGTTGSGWLSDRFDSRVLLSIYYGLRGLSLMILPYSFASFYGLSMVVVFYGLDWFATVPPTVKITARLFGREKAPIMFGWLMCIHQMGGFSAAFAAGTMRMELGTYLQAFIVSGIMCLIGRADRADDRAEARGGRDRSRHVAVGSTTKNGGGMGDG